MYTIVPLSISSSAFPFCAIDHSSKPPCEHAVAQSTNRPDYSRDPHAYRVLRPYFCRLDASTVATSTATATAATATATASTASTTAYPVAGAATTGATYAAGLVAIGATSTIGTPGHRRASGPPAAPREALVWSDGVKSPRRRVR